MRALTLIVLLAAIAISLLTQSATAGQVNLIDHLARGKLAAGEWLIEFDRICWVPTDGEVSGLAFGPGGHELAYSVHGPTGSALWVASVAECAENADWRPRQIAARPRLLWQAPDGAELSGIPWWAPDGSGIAVLVRRAAHAELMLVDYASGAAMTLADGTGLADLAWAFNGEHLVYVIESDDVREVWLQTNPPSDPRQLGKGGHNVRWRVDGTLTWLDPISDSAWCQYEWHPTAAAARALGAAPARPPGAQWSPNGRLCAMLVTADEDDEKQLVICSAGSPSGDVVPLPLVKPHRLLGWSPDSRLLLLLVEPDLLLTVTSEPPAAGAEQFLDTEWPNPDMATLFRRACALTMPWTAPDAPAPAWSSGSDLIAYVAADEENVRGSDPSSSSMKLPDGLGQVIVQALKRDYWQKEPTEQERERDQVLSNMMEIALALQMYLADNGGIFPPAEDTGHLMSIIEPYLSDQDVFVRPGSEGELCVEYLMPPGVQQSEISDPTTLPVAIADYHPNFVYVAYADGHAAVFYREGTRVNQELTAWWEQLEQRRREDPYALPPPYPRAR
jgi:prepilin-type processing-associated H-X9-DG protein